MAKLTKSVSLKGILNTGVMTITHIDKEGEKVYSLEDILEEFHGKNITLSIKEENEIEPVNVEDKEFEL